MEDFPGLGVLITTKPGGTLPRVKARCAPLGLTDCRRLPGHVEGGLLPKVPSARFRHGA
ncbi:MAG: hypothetical protein NXH82_10770 [Rhodobacteraceae bacterium]|nr:hypothetical protein [Paracoccaceae bacterium]